MKNKILATVAMGLLAGPMAAGAVTISSNGDMTDLEVGGALYDVSWNFGTSEPTAADFALFWGDPDFAGTFMQAVYTAFTSSRGSYGAGFVFPLYTAAAFAVDYAPLTSNGLVVWENGIWYKESLNPFVHVPYATYDWIAWGSVTAKSVPEPSTLALFGLGLLGLGLSKWRKPS